MDLDTLNPSQREAVETLNGPLLILAGAGSGKTRVLTYRIAHLIDNGVYPDNILAITFTNKAAKEMKERIEALVDERAKSIWVGTFHSVCVRILRQHIDKLGYDKSFVIYDTSDQEKLVKECLKELNIDEKQFPPKSMLSSIGNLKDNLIDWQSFKRDNMNKFEKKNLVEVYERYQKKLENNNALDFDDIIMKTVKLLMDNEDILSYYHRKFNYILVDEYQDTNGAQYNLIKILASAHKNLCVVGDDDQSIYGWRGADIRNILEFEKDYDNTKIIKLEQNYRCTKRILDAANCVIANNENRKNKKLWTENEIGESIKFFKGNSDREESGFIAETVQTNINEGYSAKDFAILYRTNAMSRIIEESLMNKGIPYKLIGGLKFYDRKEVKDVIAYLRVINNPADSVSLDRIVNVPKRGIGDSSLDKIKEFAASQDVSLYSAMLDIEEISTLTKRASNSIVKFIGIMNTLIMSKETMSVSEIIREILDKTDYIEELRKEQDKDKIDRIQNVEEFYSAAVEFESSDEEDKSLAAFLEKIALVSDQDNINDDSRVTLMTLHTAKGLEFPVVFIAGFEEGVFPHFRAQEDEEEMEEERRLCYVGITRAKKHLYLTCARQRLLFGRTTFNAPSSFVEEIPEDIIQDISPKPRESFNRVYNHEAQAPKVKAANRNIYSKVEMPVMENKKMNTIGKSEIKAGIKIKHKVFGKGLVISTRPSGGDTQITVHFESAGLKNLLLGSAPIEIL
ncbi:DNA helicase PcrA [Clostridium cylindrosporum]|uniref:DNA helicase PcrA n=1 Tax=Clostridium cylindrosporum TaxID=1495 RepID=UPI00065C7249